MDLQIKICGITSFEDASVAVDAGANALGFMFYEQSARFIPIETAGELVTRLSPFVIKVGVFVNPDRAAVLSAIATCGLNILQFHGEEPPEFCSQFGMMAIKAFRMKDASVLEQLPLYQTDAFLLDSYVAGIPGGTGERFNWDLAVEAKRFGKPIFLAGGLNAANVAEAVRKVQPYAIDVSSGVESAPGKKDPQKIREFIAAARSASTPAT
jgi:phosphoribosylanthranilate isomerase